MLYGFWVANLIAFDGDAVRELAAEFLALAEKQGTTVPLIIGHRITGNNLLHTGNIAHSRAHLDRAFALYDFTMHREQAMRFGHDARVAILSHRSLALWLAGSSLLRACGCRTRAPGRIIHLSPLLKLYCRNRGS